MASMWRLAALIFCSVVLATAEEPTTTTTTEEPEMELAESEVEGLLRFVVGEIQKLKLQNREIDACHGLEIGSVLRGRKQMGKTTNYTLTLKVQPTLHQSEDCSHLNSTLLEPEICEADVQETSSADGDKIPQRTLLRSTCLQVEELQD